MSSSSTVSENLPPRTLARLAREVRDLQQNPPEGVRLLVDEETGLPANLSELVVRTGKTGGQKFPMVPRGRFLSNRLLPVRLPCVSRLLRDPVLNIYRTPNTV
jgi:hypothetical protein